MVNESDRDKLDALAARIAQAQQAADPTRQRSGEVGGVSRAIVRAVRIGSDFVASVMVPMVAGIYIDRTFGSAPWGMLGLLTMGFGLGIWVLVRAIMAKTNETSEDDEINGPKE